MSGTINNVTLTLRNLSHTWASDIDMLLVGPAGQKVLLFSDVGDLFSLNNATVTLSDAADASLPGSGSFVTGTYKPTDYAPADTFPAPAPAGPFATALSTFNGLSPEGMWCLYVVDDGPGDTGTLNEGWSLTITTQQAPPIMSQPTLASSNVTLSWSAIAGRSYRVQYKSDLNSTNWTDLAGDVAAVGTNAISVDTTVSGATRRFYRVQVLP
jgi:subtilisin-like proprotein convertase family protein